MDEPRRCCWCEQHPVAVVVGIPDDFCRECGSRLSFDEKIAALRLVRLEAALNRIGRGLLKNW